MGPGLKLTILLSTLTIVFAASFPEKWDKCKASKEDEMKPSVCLSNTINKIVKGLCEEEIKELNLSSLEPYRIHKMVINDQLASRAFQVHLKLTNLEFYGFKNNNATKVLGRVTDPKDFYLRIETVIPDFLLLSDYKIKGNMLIIPLVGSGKLNITFKGLRTLVEIFGTSQIKDGKEYLKIVNGTIDGKHDRIWIHMDNLFNGNKELGDIINRVLNDNSDELYIEMKKRFEEQLLKNFLKYYRKVFEHIEYKDLFIFE